MSRPQQRPTWPFLCILLVLFVLSVKAPRGWERVARLQAVGNLLLADASGDHGPGHHLADEPLDMAPRFVTTVPTFVEPAPAAVAEPVDNWHAAPARITEATNTHPEDYVSEAVPVESMVVAVEPVYEEPNPPFANDAAGRAPQLEEVPLETVIDPAPVADDQEPSPSFVSDGVADEEPTYADPLESAPEANDADEVATALPASNWYLTGALWERIDRLRNDCDCSAWAQSVHDALHALPQVADAASERAAMAQLLGLTRGAVELMDQLPEGQAAVELRRVHYLLVRRLEIWALLPAFGAQPTMLDPAPVAPERLGACLREVDDVLGDGPIADGWKDYLELAELSALTNDTLPVEESRRLARRCLARMEQAGLSDRQRQFISRGAMNKLSQHLRHWAARHVQREQILEDLARFEQSGMTTDAAILAEHAFDLACSPSEQAQRISRWLDTHYRNSNVRVAITAELINRLLPTGAVTEDAVHDRVLGIAAHGRSQTSTNLRVQLAPDSRRLLMTLRADGLVSAWTRSSSGPAMFASRSDSTFSVQKPLEMNSLGIQTSPASGDASSQTRLRSMETSFDGVPLVGVLIENAARSKFAESQPAAQSEIEQKVASQAEARMDQEASRRLDQVNQTLHDRIQIPLNRMSLGPTVVETQTTADRLIMRLRIAHYEQLASHSPRPRAPAGSLASMQVHESLLNNIVQQLNLDGQTLSLAELRARIKQQLNLAEDLQANGTGGDLSFTFASQDAVRLRCDEGRIELNLSIAELRKGEQHWQNFIVRVHYIPQMDQLHARLVRDGVVQLRGTRLNTKGQIAVRGMFSQVFPQERPLELLPAKLADHPRLTDLHVNQFKVSEGWLAVAIGPRSATGPIREDDLARRPMK